MTRNRSARLQRVARTAAKAAKVERKKSKVKRSRSATRRISKVSRAVRGKRAKWKETRAEAVRLLRAACRRAENLKEKFRRTLEPLREQLALADGAANRLMTLSGMLLPDDMVNGLESLSGTLADALADALQSTIDDLEAQIAEIKSMEFEA